MVTGIADGLNANGCWPTGGLLDTNEVAGPMLASEARAAVSGAIALPLRAANAAAVSGADLPLVRSISSPPIAVLLFAISAAGVPITQNRSRQSAPATCSVW